MESDLVQIMLAVCEGRLPEAEIKWSDNPCVCVVLASGGYPESSEKGKVIMGLEKAEKKAVVFHAATKLVNGEYVTNGGRVLGISAQDDTIVHTIVKVYKAVAEISFENMQYRTDIGKKALR